MTTNVTCCAYNCGNSYGQEGVTFHRFPNDKPELLKQWLEAIEKPTWTPGKQHFLCSEHFVDDMFNEKSGYRFIKFDGIPTKFHSLPKPRALFPSDIPFRFLTVKQVEEDHFKGYVIEAKLRIEEEANFYDWLKLHEDVAKVKYRMVQNPPKSMKNLSFKSEYVCRHTSTSSSCPAKLLVRIRSNNQKFSKPDSESGSYSCTVVLYHLHNHRVESNSFGVVATPIETTIPEEIQPKLLEIFKGGYTSEDALALLQTAILEEHPDDFAPLLMNPEICPELESIRQFYQNYIDTEGTWSPECIIDSLEKEIEKINADEGKVQMQKINDDIIVALCTPLMQRAHSLKTSGEIVFCDNSRLMSGCKCYIYTLMAYSGSEGLPLGVLLTTSDNDMIVKAGFQLLNEVLPDKAFGQYGKLGPEIFFAAYNTAEERALTSIFPDSTILVCSYSLITSLWRWLWDPESGIEEDDCCILFSLMLDIMKMKDAEEFKERYERAVKNEIVLKYPVYVEKLQEVSDLSEKWAMRFKNEFADKEISAFEMASLVLRDPMLRGKAFNITQRLRTLSQDVETYLKQKINHCINNTLDKFLPASYHNDMKKVEELEVDLLSSGQFKVLNTKSVRNYFVDMETCLCSCPLGLRGSRCQHQYAVTVSRKIDVHHSIPNEDTIKKELHWIATNSMNSLFGPMVRETFEGDVGFEEVDDEDYDPRRDSNRKLIKGKTIKKSLTPKEEAKAILDRVVKDIIQRYETNPMEYHRAIVAMAVSYQSLHYDIPIMNALKNFGKNAN